MAALATKGPLVTNSEEVEILVCRKALEFATNVGFQEVIVEANNATVMRGLTTSPPKRSILGNIYEDARYLATRFKSLSASCV